MTVFRSLCGEWFETFMDCFLVNGREYTSLIYYVALVIVGGFTVSVLEIYVNLYIRTYGTYNARDDQNENQQTTWTNRIE